MHFVHFRRRATLRLVCSWTPQIERYKFEPWSRFSKAPETFQVRKAIFSLSVSKNGRVYTPVTSCMKRTSVHIQNTRITRLCNALTREISSWTLEKKFCVGCPDAQTFRDLWEKGKRNSASLHPNYRWIWCSEETLQWTNIPSRGK